MSELHQPTVSLTDRKSFVGKRLQERDDERTKEVNKRKEEAEKSSSETESLVFFMETLTTGVATIKEGLSLAAQQPKEGLITYFDSLSTKLSSIQKFVTDSTIFLSSYDLAHKQQQLNDLQNEITMCRDNLMPKKKFAFKNKKKLSSAEDRSTVKPSLGITTSKPSSLPYDMSSNEYRIGDLNSQVVNVAADSIYEKDVIISSANSCTIKIKGVPSAMHLTNLVDSTVLCGPCTRSIFIEQCSNCVLVLACQQLRIHNASDSTFFVHVTSKAIIEDSKNLKFAPYQLRYDDIDTHYETSGLSRQINNWYDVDDFNWLVKDKQSPNWSVLPEEHRIEHSID